MNYRNRLVKLRRRMSEEGIAALLLTHLADIRYLCGFTGSNAVLTITATRMGFFTDGRYREQARQETAGTRVVIARTSAQREACLWLASSGVEHCAFDPAHTTIAEMESFRGWIKEAGKGIPRGRFFRALARPLVSGLREVKDAEELKLLEQAAYLGVKLFEDLLPHIRPGVAETSVAGQLEMNARVHGAEGMSFETILASGPRSALPHGRATASRLPRRGFVTLDFGVILNGYCSDMTRTLFLGRATSRERFTYDAVRRAQQAAVGAVKPGASCGEIDEAARGVLRQAGLARFFTHSTGHGVGLEIHEAPRIAAARRETLVPGMVVTIEPGVYIPGHFGVRIEDMVAVTKDGARVLTPAPTTWKQI